MSAAAISCVQIIHIIAANQIQKQTNEQASKQTKSVATFDSFKENNKRSRLNNLVHVKCITLKMGKTPNDYHYLSGEITAFCIHKLNAFFQNPFSLRQHSLFACLSVVHSFGCVVMLVVNLIERKHLASSSVSQNVHAHIPKWMNKSPRWSLWINLSRMSWAACSLKEWRNYACCAHRLPGAAAVHTVSIALNLKNDVFASFSCFLLTCALISSTLVSVSVLCLFCMVWHFRISFRK